MKLDTKTVAALQLAGRTDVIHFDDGLPGFGFRLRESGERILRSWICQYRVQGKSQRVLLGSADVLSAEQARAAAKKLLARVALGHDPRGEREGKRQQAARTFRLVAEAYLAAKQPELRPVSFRIAKLYLTGPYFRPLHTTGINDITHPDMAACLSTIARNHSPNTAACARRAVSALFRWAMEEGWATGNPIIGTRKPARPPPRERVLNSAELVAIWNACGNDDCGRILRLLILLGSRRQECGGIRWSELDLDANTWTLPAERAKNHRAHTITLPSTALAIIASVPRTDRDHLFGDRAAGGFVSWSRGKQDLDRKLGAAVAPWRVHDIRRTVATGMADIGVEPHHIEAVLNHHSGHRAGIAGIYNRSPYERAVKAALARWSEHVLALVEGRESNVVPMPRVLK
jgi:integrase